MRVDEEWRPIEGTNEDYWVSSLGRVMSKKRGRTWLLKPVKCGHYLCVDICVNNLHNTQLIHRLVAQTFIPNPEELPEVNHKDENQHNNCVYNLEWCTRQYNHGYGTARERNVAKRKKAVQQIDMNTGLVVAEYSSLSEATRLVGWGINNCVRGRAKSACGYYWKYKEE